jgi:hypothetical protein
MSNQKRIVLNSKHEPVAQKILDETGIDNLSQLFSILVVNYGARLVKDLKGKGL